MIVFNAKYDRKNKRAIIKECAIPDCYTLAEAWSHALTYFINTTGDDEILVDIRWNRIGEKEMSFKTDYKEITLKELVNLNCIARHLEVVLHDYNALSTGSYPVLSKDGITVDEIPEIFANWYVEHFTTSFYSGHTVYVFTIREP